MKRILLVGGTGQLGTALREAYAGVGGYEVVAPSRAACDLSADGFPATLRALLAEYAPWAVINCAALHSLLACEQDPRAAFEVNAVAVGEMSRACDKVGARFVQMSTDYVFEGRDEPYGTADAGDPVNAYGVSKRAGERLALINSDQSYVIRTAGLYGASGSSSKGLHVLERVVRAAASGESFRAVGDVFFNPSYAPHVARAIVDIISRGQFGIWHAAGRGCVSWYEFASYGREVFASRESLETVERIGALEKIRCAEMKEPFARPMRVDLGTSNVLMPSWRKGVEEYVAAREAPV